MKKKSLISIQILIAIIIVVLTGLTIWFGLIKDNEYGNFKMIFERNYSTDNEQKAIEVTESINYSGYVNLSRFYGNWANFIDIETINHYNETYFNAKRNKEDVAIFYKYNASCKFFENINLTIKSEDDYYLNIFINNEDYATIFHEGYYSKYPTDNVIISLINSTSINIIKNKEEYYLRDDFHFNDIFENVYLINMELRFNLHRGPLNAYYVNVFQIVILDSDYNLTMVILLPSSQILS